MTTLTVELPPTVSEAEARLMLAIKLYEAGRVSLGKAAEIAGYSKRAFIELLSQQQIPVVNYSPEELEREVTR
jgi:predicted HTH domain antitoxin